MFLKDGVGEGREEESSFQACLIKEDFLETLKVMMGIEGWRRNSWKGINVIRDATCSCTSIYSQFPFQQPSRLYNIIPPPEHMDGWRRARHELTAFSWQVQFSFLWGHYSQVLKVLPLKGLLFILQMLGRFVRRLPIAIIDCEMVFNKGGKELMGSAHLGLVSVSSLFRSNPPLLDDEAIFWPSQGPAVEETDFLTAAWAQHVTPLPLVLYLPRTLSYSTFELFLLEIASFLQRTIDN